MDSTRYFSLKSFLFALIFPAIAFTTGSCTGPGMTAQTEYDDAYFNRTDLETARREALELKNNPSYAAGDEEEGSRKRKKRRRGEWDNHPADLSTGPTLFLSPWYVSPGLGWSRGWGPSWNDPFWYVNTLGWSPRPWAWSNWYATPYMGWNNTWGWYSGWQGGAWGFGDPWSMGWGYRPGWNSWGWNTGGWNGWGWNQGGWNSWNNPMNPWYSPFYCWTSPRQTNPQAWGGNSNTATRSGRTRMAMSPGNTSSSYQRPGSARNVRPQGGRSSSSSGWSGSGSGSPSGSSASSSLWRSSSSGNSSSSGSSSFFSSGSSSWGGSGGRSSSFSGGTRGGSYGGGSSGASGGRSGSGGPRGGRSR